MPEIIYGKKPERITVGQVNPNEGVVIEMQGIKSDPAPYLIAKGDIGHESIPVSLIDGALMTASSAPTFCGALESAARGKFRTVQIPRKKFIDAIVKLVQEELGTNDIWPSPRQVGFSVPSWL